MYSFETEIDSIVERIIADITAEFDFEIQDGVIAFTDANINKAILLKGNVEAIISNSGFYAAVRSAIDDYLDVATSRIGEVKRMFSLTDLSGFDTQTIRAIQAMDYGKLQGVAEKFVAGVGDKFVNSVATGQQFSTLLDETVKQAERFKNEALTQMNTMQNVFRQNLEDKLAEEIGFDDTNVWEYMGAPLQANSHKECIWALTQKAAAPYFTNEEKEEFERGGGPLTIVHGEPRWNCQHNFFMTSLTLKEAGLA